MSAEFWIPLVIGIVSIIWNYFQSRRLLKVEMEAKSKNLVHKFQFEKEFKIYKEIWPKLVELKSAAEKIEKTTTDKETEIHSELKSLEINYHLVRDYFERNKPFYSERVYNKIKVLPVVLSSDSFWAVNSANQAKNEVLERRSIHLKKIVGYIDDVADLIRGRINFQKKN
jgi:hypothetical protein